MGVGVSGRSKVGNRIYCAHGPDRVYQSGRFNALWGRATARGLSDNPDATTIALFYG